MLCSLLKLLFKLFLITICLIPFYYSEAYCTWCLVFISPFIFRITSLVLTNLFMTINYILSKSINMCRFRSWYVTCSVSASYSVGAQIPSGVDVLIAIGRELHSSVVGARLSRCNAMQLTRPCL